MKPYFTSSLSLVVCVALLLLTAFRAGSDDGQPVSPVVIDRIERVGQALHFHFTGEPSYDYTVEYTDSLSSTNWLALSTNRSKILAIDIVVTNAFTESPARFFRVRKQHCFCR